MVTNSRVFNKRTKESGIVVRSGLFVTIKWIDSGSYSSLRRVPNYIVRV